MKKTILIVFLAALLLATPALALDRVRIGERINVSALTPDTFPAGEPFHIVHGWTGMPAVPFGFYLYLDGQFVPYTFIEKEILLEDPLTISRLWVHNFMDGLEGEHVFTGKWWLACSYAVEIGYFEGPCPDPKAPVVVQTRELAVDFE